MFIAALFLIAKIEKQPRCPSAGILINKLCHIQTIEYYSVLKRNELSSHEKNMGNLQYILLNKRNQSEKATYFMIPNIFGKRQNYENNKKMNGC